MLSSGGRTIRRRQQPLALQVGTGGSLSWPLLRFPLTAFPTFPVAWQKQYPEEYETPDPTAMPEAWQDALTALENSGLIPDITLTTGSGTYPHGTSGASKTVCNSAAMCRADGDIWDAPDGMLGVSFDDVSGRTQRLGILHC